LGILQAVGERWTVSALVQRFNDAPGYASPVTLDCRSTLAAAMRADPLGRVRVGRLGPLLLSTTVQRWRASAVPPGAVRGRVNLLRSAVTWAADHGFLAGNVLAGVQGMPIGVPRTHTPIPVMRELLSIAHHDMIRARGMLARRPGSREAETSAFRAQQNLLLVQLVADTGLRRGELAALRSDDLLGRTLWVERALKSLSCGVVVVGPPKMYKTGRVTVSAATAQLWDQYLREWFEPSVVSGVDTVWLFVAKPSASRHVHPTTLASRFDELARRVGTCDAVTLHRVRHTVATALVSLGDLDGAQRRLRHSRLDTTLRHYVDTTGLGDDTEVADELERFYRGGGDPLNSLADFEDDM
jgi:integrase